MKQAGFSLTGIYVFFMAGILAASLVLLAGWHFHIMPAAALWAAYTGITGLLAGIFLWKIWHWADCGISRMDDMLDGALNGSSAILNYDEARLSLLESKLHRLLTVCASSAHGLAEEKKRLQTLVADISHQTKTPIANILLYTQLLEEQKDLLPESLKLARQISSQSEKLGFLIEALIKMSRLETGIISVAPRTSPLGELLNRCLDGIAEKAGGKGIDLHISCAPELQAVFDPKWTEEAVGNIMDNAVKYTLPGGSISVAAAAYEMFIRIDIADTGIGIEEPEINRIFQRFYRSPGVSREQGVGIGLYLSREILNLQGGYVKVKSKPLHGSLFSVFLPRN